MASPMNRPVDAPERADQHEQPAEGGQQDERLDRVLAHGGPFEGARVSPLKCDNGGTPLAASPVGNSADGRVPTRARVLGDDRTRRRRLVLIRHGESDAQAAGYASGHDAVRTACRICGRTRRPRRSRDRLAADRASSGPSTPCTRASSSRAIETAAIARSRCSATTSRRARVRLVRDPRRREAEGLDLAGRTTSWKYPGPATPSDPFSARDRARSRGPSSTCAAG